MPTDALLSPNFHLSEFTASQTAVRRALRNDPSDRQVANLRRLALRLEEVRHALNNAPLLISSGFRSKPLNDAVQGAVKSAHLEGLAADFTAPAHGTPLQICRALIAYGLPFDQLICEGTWVHLAIEVLNAKPRNQYLQVRFANGKATYTPGAL